jgi:uncharacterized membrane protein YqjE
METGADSVGQLAMTSKRFARLLLTIGENRLELLMVAAQEERELVMRAILLALGMAVFGLLAGMTLTGAVVVLWWAYSPVGVLVTLAALYGTVGLCLYGRLTRLMHDWQTFSVLLDQLRKDRASLEQTLS